MEKVLLVHDLFSSSKDLFLQEIRTELKDYETIIPEFPINPQQALSCLKECCYRQGPDILIGWHSGGFLAQQCFDYDRILVNPDYQLSSTLTLMLNGQEEMDFPYVCEREDGKKEMYISPDLIKNFVEMESQQFDGLSHSHKMAFGLFWIDKNKENQQIHQAHYHDITYLPGKDYFDSMAIKNVCKVIKSLLDD